MRTCVVCGSTYGPRPNERPSMFAKRSRCGVSCRPVNHPDTTGRARAAARFPGEPCEVCAMPYGGRGRVQRHHRDSDRMNNDRSNIAFLCVKHHKAAHKLSDGKVGGGPRGRINERQRAEGRQRAFLSAWMLVVGMSVQEIADYFGVQRHSVMRWFRKYPHEAIA